MYIRREKIYKYRFKKLGISKNLKASDAIAMARVKAYRGARGIPSEFWRRGKLVQPVKLQRTVARLYDEFEPLAAEDQYRTEPIETLLPPDIVVLAPHTPCGSGMVKLETLEEVCLTFQRFAISSRSGAPSSSSPRCSSGTTPGPVRATTDTRVLWWNMERDSKILRVNYLIVLPFGFYLGGGCSQMHLLGRICIPFFNTSAKIPVLILSF